MESSQDMQRRGSQWEAAAQRASSVMLLGIRCSPGAPRQFCFLLIRIFPSKKASDQNDGRFCPAWGQAAEKVVRIWPCIAGSYLPTSRVQHPLEKWKSSSMLPEAQQGETQSCCLLRGLCHRTYRPQTKLHELLREEERNDS